MLRLWFWSNAGAAWTPAADPQEGYYEQGVGWLDRGIYSVGLSAATPALWRGPVYPAFLALTELPRRDPWPSHPRLALALLSALGAGFVFALASRLGGRAAGWAAAVLYAFDAGQVLSAWSLNVHAFYGLVLLALAGAAAAWADAPTPAGGALLGAAFGASLLVRSTHFLAVPLVLAAGVARRARPRASAKSLAWPLLGLCAALLPWTARNALQFRVFQPLDAYSGAVNLYAASRGETHTATVDGAVAQAAAEDPGLAAAYAGGQSAAYPRLLALARRRILAAPVAYALGCARRWWDLFLPWLPAFAAALFVAWRRRSRAVWAAAAVFASLSAYALVAVQDAYGEALRPLAAVFFGLALAGLPPLAKKSVGAPPAEERAARGLGAAFAGLLAAAFAFSVVLLAREAAAVGPWARGGPRPAPERAESLLRAVAARDADGRAALDLGMYYAMEGRGAAACAQFERASRSPASRAAARPRRIDCLAAAGRTREAAREADQWAAAALGDPAEEARALTAQAGVLSAAHRGAEAARSLARAAALSPDDPRVRRALAALDLLAGRLPAAEAGLRAALAASATTPRGERADLGAGLAAVLWRLGRGAEASAALDAALAEEPARACHPSSDLADEGLLPPGFFDLCVERFPGDARLLADRGVALWGAGRKDEAVASLRAAAAADPSDLEAALSLAAASPDAASREGLRRALRASKAPAGAPARLRGEELLKGR